MKKVLHVSCDGLGNGGVQSVIMNICRHIKQMQFDIILFTKEKRYYDEEFEGLGGEIFRIPNYEGSSIFRKRIDYYIRFVRIFIGTYKVLKRYGPYTAIHCHNDLESGICCLAAIFAGVKIRISHAHTAYNRFAKKNLITYFYRKFLQLLMNKVANVKIGCSEEAFIKLFGKKNLTKEGSFIISNPIDLEKFAKVKKNRKNQHINIVHIGRFCDNKNQIFLIELLPNLLMKQPNILLQLMGFGEEYRNKLYRRSLELGVESNVQFLPSGYDKIEILNNADLFIFPSKTEGFGIALLEAQAMSVPCIVSDTVPRIIDCGLCEFLSLQENKEVWVDKIIKIISKDCKLILNRKQLETFDLQNFLRKIKEIYLESY